MMLKESNMGALEANYKSQPLMDNKVTPVSRYRHECEPVSRMLITVNHDAT